MRFSYAFIILLILISLAVSVFLYPLMPEQMASHWNSRGEVDDYLPKFWGLFLMPLVLAFMLILFIIIPSIDPLKENIGKFRKYFDGFIVLISLFLIYIHILTIIWSLGVTYSMNLALIPALSGLFFYCGVLVEKASRNWFIGIRTPWTLSSDRVWNKTHKIGGKLFKISALIMLLGIFFENFLIYFIMIPLLTTVVVTVAYSYFEYQKEDKTS